MSYGLQFNYKNLPFVKDYYDIEKYGIKEYSGRKTFKKNWNAVKKVAGSQSLNELYENTLEVAPEVMNNYFMSKLQKHYGN